MSWLGIPLPSGQAALASLRHLGPGWAGAQDLHVTLCHLGRDHDQDPRHLGRVARAVATVMAETPRDLHYQLAPTGDLVAWRAGEGYAVVAELVPTSGTLHLRRAVVDALSAAGVWWDWSHDPWRPHVTLGRFTALPPRPARPAFVVEVRAVELHLGGAVQRRWNLPR